MKTTLLGQQMYRKCVPGDEITLGETGLLEVNSLVE